MPGLVGTYPIVPFTTPVNGDDLDAAVVVSHDNTTAAALTSHDADGTIHLQSSTLAARAGAGIVGRKWLTTDGLRVYYDTGAAWSEIDYLCKTAGGTVAASTTFSNGLISSAGTTLAAFTASGLATLSGGLTTTTGTFSGAVSTGALTATTGTFSNAVSMTALTATSGTFSGTITSDTPGSNFIQFSLSAAAKAFFGISGSAGSIVNGSVSGDAYIRTNGGNLLFSVDSGGSSGFQLKSTGQFLVGTAVTASSVAGDVVLAYTKGYRTVGNAGTTTFRLIDAVSIGPDNDNVRISADGTRTVFGAVTTVGGSAGGDVILANVRSLRGVNAAGTATKHLISINASDTVVIGADIPGGIALGAPASVASVGAGEVVVANNKSIRSSNNAGSATFALIYLDNTDKVQVDANGRGAVFGAGAVFTGGLSGITTLAMGGALSGVTTLSMSSTLTGATRVESGKFKGNSATPGIANGVAIGTGGAVSTTISGTDAAGKINIVAGNASLTNGSLCTVTFNSAYSSAPFVLLHYVNSGSTTVLAYGVANVSTTGFTIDVPLAPTGGQGYTFYYTVIQ
jgi:hypothetical protein